MTIGIRTERATARPMRPGGVAMVLTLAAATLAAPVALADLDLNITGFLRQEAAYGLGNANPYNQYGNLFNGREVVNSLGGRITRQSESSEPDWNLFASRGELDIKARFNDNWEGYLKLRAFGEWSLDKEFSQLDYFHSGFDQGRGSVFEANDEEWMLDVPAFYLDYNNGPLWLRIGNQQIAWGEAIFFRVFDVPNGLDLRRHSFLDVAAEEYSDKRVPSLGIRGSYRFENDWEVEAFAQHFRPTVLMPLGSPYNVIASQFVVQEKQGWEAKDDKVNFGVRVTGRAGDFDLSFMAVHRHNPDGVFRWTETGINPFAGLPGLDAVGQLLAQTAFTPDPNGVWTSDEWFHYAGLARLDGINGLTASATEFPAAATLGAFPINAAACSALPVDLSNNLRACAALELDVFFDPVNGVPFGGGLGPLVGHIAREYFDEQLFGIGMNYVFNGAPNSLFDQLVMRFEATYALDRHFTNTSLSRNYIKKDELVTNLSFEKYHRFTSNFPATYFVLQWMHKTESDLVGRHVSGFNNDGVPRGASGFNALAFALQQPFPGLIWRADLAVLYDVQGGVLVQPGVRWRPRDKFQVDLYANVITSNGGNNDLMQTFEHQDEIFTRLTYYF